MAGALSHAAHPASVLDVGAWVQRVAGATLAARSEKIIEIESVQLSELTLARPLRAASNAPPGEGPRSRVVSAPAARGSREHVDHTGLSMAPSSLTKDTQARGPRARIWIPTAAIVLSILGALLAFTQRGSGDRAALPPAASTRAPPAAAKLAPNSTAVLEPPHDPEGHEPSSPVRAPDETSTEVAGSSSALPVALPRPGSARPKHHGAPSNCDPPYAIDSDGIKHFKPECFK
jgi:serine/threonine-protein kinase